MNAEKNTDVKVINFEKIIHILYKHKMTYAKVLPIILIITYIFTLTFPRYYSCSMELAPESSGGSSSLNSLASSFGLGSLDKLGKNDDAISPDLYPDLLNSENFTVTLFPVRICTKDGLVKTNYYDYVKNYRPQSLWNRYLINPLMGMTSDQVSSTFTGTEPVDIRHMDKTQQDIAGNISESIKCSIDKKTGAINITFFEYDPEVCATMSDSILGGIQKFIIEYRTKKARNDYAYYSKLRDKAKLEYDHARGIYAGTSDSYFDAISESVKSSIDSKQKEMDIKYSNYSTLASQAQLSLSKIQENTPAFTIIKSPVVPLKPAGPKRILISLIVTLLAFFAISTKILLKELS